MIQSALLKFNSLFRKPFGADLLILCDDSLGSFGLVRIADPVSRTMQTGKKPVFMRVCVDLTVIPTRSCQKFSKQICLWNLAQSIGIIFIIQIVEAI